MISPNINRRIVPIAVAISIEVAPSPNIETESAVITAVNATLTKLLPNKIVANSLSMFAIMLDINSAPGTLELTRYESLLR